MLKPRTVQSDKNLTSPDKHNKTTLELIQQSIQENDEERSKINYDVMFQNNAIEKMLGFDDIQQNLHTPRLLITNKMQTLHDMTTKSNEELSKLNARVIQREDHIHLDRTFGGTLDAKDDDKWVNMRQEKIEFDGKTCLLLSLRDVSTSHILQKAKQ